MYTIIIISPQIKYVTHTHTHQKKKEEEGHLKMWFLDSGDLKKCNIIKNFMPKIWFQKNSLSTMHD